MPADPDSALLRTWDTGPDESGSAAPSLLMFSRLTALARLAAFFGVTLCLAPFQAFLILTGRQLATVLPRIYCRLVTKLVGFRITLTGKRVKRGAILYVCNHVSYFDILVLGGLLPASFVAKNEVSGWPGVGLLARLNRTIFLDRRGSESRRGVDLLRQRLSRGDRLIVFPEATSTDGTRVVPFRSSLFQSVIDTGEVTVQPVSITYTRLNGVPLGKALRPYVAWYGDMELAPHVWEALALGRFDVTVEFHPPIRPGDLGDRKSLAKTCHESVSDGVSAALSGRTGRTLTGGERSYRVLP